MFGGHAWILLILLLAIVLIVIGPGKLSQLGGALGQSVKEFRKSQGESEAPPKQGKPDNS